MTATTKNRMVLLLIAGIPLTMILAATWLWYFVAEGELDLIGALGTANRGTLVQPPREIDAVSKYRGQQVVAYADLEPKWALLVPWGDGSCDAVCERTLYVTRQIHVAIGKDFNRIRRLFMSTTAAQDIVFQLAQTSDGHPAPASFVDYLDKEHRGLQAMRVSGQDFGGLFPEWSADNSSWYLVDTRGWIMMSYNSEIPYKDVISDLKFLLKNSSD